MDAEGSNVLQTYKKNPTHNRRKTPPYWLYINTMFYAKISS